MAEFCDEALALWDGKSRGTKHMITELNRLGKSVEIVCFPR